MAYTPHHITGLALNGDGWIVTQNNNSEPGSQDKSDSQSSEIALTPSCERLLRVTKLDPSCEIFNGSRHPKSGDADDEPRTTIDELTYSPTLPNLIQKVIADVRRLGAPSHRDLRRTENEGGKGGGREDRRRSRRGRDGKVARLEEQRRLRQQQERQKPDRTRRDRTGKADGRKGADAKGEDDAGEAAADDGGSVAAGGDYDPYLAEAGISVELRLPAVFNSLRVLIALIRPMLDHPRSKDLNLKMKNGPSIQREGRARRYYLISKHVYSCVSHGCWNEINREYGAKLLNEVKEGLLEEMSKVNGDGRYELDAEDWIVPLFDHESYTNRDILAEKSMGLAANSEVASRLHDALMNRFENEHDEKRHLLRRSIDRLQDRLTSAISRRYRDVRLTVYGSCLSGLALEGSHDVDVSIFIPELNWLKRGFDEGGITADEYEKRMRRIIFRVRDSLEYNRSFADLFAVTRARVPVIKGTDPHAKNPYTQDGSLSFDLCFLNDIAVVNSSLLREYSLLDGRVRMLMLSVKSLAKTGGIASAVDGTLSSYSWLNMVVFYLQCIGLIPVLQCPEMMEAHGFEPDLTGNPWHNVNGLQTFYLTRELVATKNIWQCSPQVKDANMSMLLYGFLRFYSSIFPQQTVAASIRFGKCTLQKTSFRHTSKLWRICMEDPFETCDSHVPHDLGCHVKEGGQKIINEYLAAATRELAALMQLGTASDDAISKFLSNWIGPAATPNDGKLQNNSTNAVQPHRGQQHNAKSQNKARNSAARHNRNAAAKGKQHNINDRGRQSNGKQGNGASAQTSAGPQTKGDRGGGGGKGDGPPQKQNTKRRRGKGAKKDRIDPNGTEPNAHAERTDKPGVTKQFIEVQKARLNKMSEEKNRNAQPKQKNKHRNNAENGGTPDRPLGVKCDLTGDRSDGKTEN